MRTGQIFQRMQQACGSWGPEELLSTGIWQWRKTYWIVFFAIAAFLFYHILINPSLSDVGALQQNSVRTLLTAMAVYGLATLALWLALPFREWLQGRSRKTPSISG